MSHVSCVKVALRLPSGMRMLSSAASICTTSCPAFSISTTCCLYLLNSSPPEQHSSCHIPNEAGACQRHNARFCSFESQLALVYAPHPTKSTGKLSRAALCPLCTMALMHICFCHQIHLNVLNIVNVFAMPKAKYAASSSDEIPSDNELDAGSKTHCVILIISH